MNHNEPAHRVCCAPRRLALIIFVGLAFFVRPVSVSAEPSDRERVRNAQVEYRSALQLAELDAGGRAVEEAFEKAVALGEALRARRGEEAGFIEAMADVEFDALQRSLPGMILNREEVVFAHPAPAFFLELARAHGRRQDVRFFEEYTATFPDGTWWSYIEQVTDFTGCTSFGNGELVARYAGWLKFRRRYRDAYQGAVAERLEHIEEQVGETGCACGTAEDVLRELQQFARRFPRSSATPDVRARITELREKRSQMRFDCLSH